MDILLKDTSSPLFWYGIILLSIVMMIYSSINMMKSSFKDKDYYSWIIIVGFVPILGPILYLFIGRKQKLKQH